MSDVHDNGARGISRRSITTSAAWAVPAIAIAATVPSAAASVQSGPTPPAFLFASGHKNPGNRCTSACVPKQSYSVPVTISNPTDDDYVLVLLSYAIRGRVLQVHSVHTGSCQSLAVSFPACATDIPAGSKTVLIPSHTTALTFQVTSATFGSSPNGSQDIPWRLYRVSDCALAASGTAHSNTSPPDC